MDWWKILSRWLASRVFEMAAGSPILLTLVRVADGGEPGIYEFSEYVQGFGIIGFGYFASGFFLISLYLSFVLKTRYVLLSIMNLAAFCVVALLVWLLGSYFPGGVMVYAAQGALVFISSVTFGALFAVRSKE